MRLGIPFSLECSPSETKEREASTISRSPERESARFRLEDLDLDPKHSVDHDGTLSSRCYDITSDSIPRSDLLVLLNQERFIQIDHDPLEWNGKTQRRSQWLAFDGKRFCCRYETSRKSSLDPSDAVTSTREVERLRGSCRFRAKSTLDDTSCCRASVPID